ncbi:J domain-containing protein [Candidatus Synechococcus calcipolaris G9]|uniref:J domain-containing protein n=1 Tax=Candidatus Synechococcus calcipolaris G9 TaxID=1497997 RepID=A0ABT6EZN1_9SYNE|nr:J domain-containing protein [Candidatus Synechococcus calcipolaris]MDG2991027.1 J domain-containing protein [Candidatus Synechococcus calcipolaris G9]
MMPEKNAQGLTYYQLLEVEPGCSLQELRRAYREKSKVYHPDTTTLPMALARDRFDRLKEAYATLTNPEERLRYDRHLQTKRMIRSSDLGEGLPPKSLDVEYGLPSRPYRERPLSPGEIFALFILGLTFVGCLVLAVIVGFTRGDWMLQALHYFSS